MYATNKMEQDTLDNLMELNKVVKDKEINGHRLNVMTVFQNYYTFFRSKDGSLRNLKGQEYQQKMYERETCCLEMVNRCVENYLQNYRRQQK